MLVSSFPQWPALSLSGGHALQELSPEFCSAHPSVLPMVSRQASHGLLSWGAQTMSHWMSTSCALAGTPKKTHPHARRAHC